MSGIILTTGVGAPFSPPLSESTVSAGDTETIEVFDADPCPLTKWVVSVTDPTAQQTWTAEIIAKHDFNNNVDFSITNLMGSPATTLLSVNAGTNPNELLLAAENNGSNAVDVCAYRLI